ncbi:MAG: hypothetical protein FJ241_11660 [Nitrospira sp.]|nr:hypothetical protein [Nitrospira sp.]
MIKFLKCVPLKDGTFTITLQGDIETDEIALIRLRGRPIKILEDTIEPQENIAELIKETKDILLSIDTKLKILDSFKEGEKENVNS